MDQHRTTKIPRVFSSYFLKKAHSPLLLTYRSSYSDDKAGVSWRWYSGTAESTCPYSWINSWENMHRQLWHAVGFLTPGLCGLGGSSYSQLEGKEGKQISISNPLHPPLSLISKWVQGTGNFPIFTPLHLMFSVPPGLGCQSPGRGIGKKMSLTSPQTKKETKQQLQQ